MDTLKCQFIFLYIKDTIYWIYSYLFIFFTLSKCVIKSFLPYNKCKRKKHYITQSVRLKFRILFSFILHFKRPYSNFSALNCKEIVNCGSTITLGFWHIKIYNKYLVFYYSMSINNIAWFLCRATDWFVTQHDRIGHYLIFLLIWSLVLIYFYLYEHWFYFMRS